MRELKLAKDAWDYANKFRVAGVRGDVSLQQDYDKQGDGIYWGLQAGMMLKANYTPEETDHRKRMNAEVPLENGELVLIDGNVYKAKVLGNYSDCVIFEPHKG